MGEQSELGAPRLSIVTPVLNGVAFVEGCVSNVAEQSCAVCEHVIVDGGSTDGTLTVLGRLAETVPGLRVLVRPGTRQSSALNAGIQASAGTVIGILNADDFYSSGTLNRIVELFASCPTPTLLVGNCTLWSEGRQTLVNRPFDLRLESMLLGPHHCPFPYNPSAYFYHKELHQTVGFYDEDDDFAMDLDFLLRVLPVVHSEYRDESWGNFRVHKGSKTELEKASGRHRRHLRRVLTKHRRRLPVAGRIALQCRLFALDARLGTRLAVRAFRGAVGS